LAGRSGCFKNKNSRHESRQRERTAAAARFDHQKSIGQPAGLRDQSN
jgi:hypothetical protein